MYNNRKIDPIGYSDPIYALLSDTGASDLYFDGSDDIFRSEEPKDDLKTEE